jgi:hypothetical protein
MKKIITTFLILTAAFFTSAILINAVKGSELPEKNDPVQKSTAENYRIQAVKMPESMSFAGENVPLEDVEVFERIDRELLVNTYWQSNSLLYFKRAAKYFPVIEPILARKGIPDDFKYLAVIESGLQNVTSPAGAKGVWQIMPKTGRELGLEVNSNIDERYHLEKATEAACDYLLDSKERLGSWTLAAAAYNAGLRGISSRMEKQLANNYYDLLVVAETARYVPRILAVKEIMSHPEKYGFEFESTDLYNPNEFALVMVDTAVGNLARFAQKFDMSYKELKTLNPWMRDGNLENKSGKMYEVKVKR